MRRVECSGVEWVLWRRGGRRGRPFHVIGEAIKRERNTAESLLSRFYSFLAYFFSFLPSSLYLTFFLSFFISLFVLISVPFFIFISSSFPLHYTDFPSFLLITIYCFLFSTNTEQFVNVGYWRTLLKLSP